MSGGIPRNHTERCRKRFEGIFRDRGDPRLLRQAERFAEEPTVEEPEAREEREENEEEMSVGDADDERDDEEENMVFMLTDDEGRKEGVEYSLRPSGQEH